MFDTVLPAVLPHILEIVSLLIMLVISYMAKKLRDWTGIQIEARHREALHSALMTGVRYALDRNVPSAQAVALAVGYAQTIGAPQAVAALGVSEDTLGQIARAKLIEATGQPSGFDASKPAWSGSGVGRP
jgi:hypothetical protein